MDFYETLSKYYDLIFPLDNKKVEFLNERISNKDKIIDLACGTGTYSIELAKKGNEVHGLDLDERMIEIARHKSQNTGTKVYFNAMDMRNFDTISNERYDFAFCIGNSLVHLENEAEIKKFILKVYNNLSEKGKFVIQIINYDRILKHNISSLPTIKNDDIEFIRNYEVNGDKILFNTTLIINDCDKEIKFNNSTPLIPLSSDKLTKILKDVGFKNIELYGKFNNEKYNKEISYATIAVASK